MKIKVCGMRDTQNIADVAALKPDYMGFIFYEHSKRFVGKNFQPAVLSTIHPKTKKVAVFVNETTERIIEIVHRFGFDFIQLHGNESAEQCKIIAEQNIAVIKAFGIDDNFDFSETQGYKPFCKYFLFDTQTSDFGGCGKTFDWSLLSKYDNKTPFFLSGGIGIKEIGKVANIEKSGLNVHAIDVNSSVEIAPGMKDIEKIKEIKLMQSSSHQTICHPEFIEGKSPNEQGYYGEFGGAYVPEMLYPNVEELRKKYLAIINDTAFQREYGVLLKDYVGRPSPLYFALGISKHYRSNIFLKREDLNHTGSHKINNTLGQILLAKRLNKTRIIAETGAGQHGVATATACALMGLQCVVYMGEVDMARQKPNVERMKMLGAQVVPATCGSKTLKDATNEAIRDWINNPLDTHYIIGSVVGPHPYPDMVARFQSVISEEIRIQLEEKTGKQCPDYVLACVGGGSNAMGTFYHFIDEPNVKLIGVEAGGKGIHSGFSAATTTLGKLGVLHASKTILMQTDDGQIVEPHSISAGLDYPGIGPQHAHLFKTGRAAYPNVTDQEAIDAAMLLTKLEGIIPALESAHAIAYLPYLQAKPNETVVICLSGRGDKDMETYIKNIH